MTQWMFERRGRLLVLVVLALSVACYHQRAERIDARWQLTACSAMFTEVVTQRDRCDTERSDLLEEAYWRKKAQP